MGEQRFVEQLAYVRAYPAELPVLSGLLPGAETPVQILIGRDDEVVPVENAEFLHDRLPVSKLDIIYAGHFAREEAPDPYAEVVTCWWQAN
ncbi:alpha/beta hydrolase [Streptomyces sp. NPDC046821]|uniref:alpha/beta fold hydrolase n=1 Tax=Streptomyces sp. NPDC046821 TaxID=3154702 RepID=UPI0033D1BE62